MDERKGYEIGHVLREMRQEYWRGIEEASESRVAETRDYVVFRLGGERYGLPSAVAREVVRMPRLVPVPRVGEYIRGVVNLRGQIVAVTDLRPLFGLKGRELPAGGRLVVVEAAGLTTALLVEMVEGIRGIEVEAVEPPTEGLAGFPREAVEGQVGGEDGLLILLNMEHILARPEFVVDQKGE
ncbi:MAG: chemotaxis protein CheW [Desulfuromonas sp.]|uniref:chemotaxis protein CheW n=1 Tax=Desulfuromonas sp. TaxID=892 RepID=UPI000CB34A9C|nr:chemotaxis protein CheW [Desulfuromonas sp.]PLX83240.1 MAG: chemotaxis protein CheW [Desulfuromonas sp.]